MTEKNEPILSTDPRQAVEEMFQITEELVARMEIETNAVATNDGSTFSLNEMSKEHVAEIYEKAANEFRKRLHEFKTVDKGLIDKLEEAQKSLGDTARNNLALLEQIEKAQQQ